jgi:ABC-type branched-chain amino acid transport systems, ATPase component
MSNKVILKVSNCKYTQKIDFVVGKNEVTMIVGPNGSGKTTFLKLVAGIIGMPCSILFYDEEISNLEVSKRVKKGIIYVPSERSIFPELTVKENLRIGLSFIKNKIRKEENLKLIYSIFPNLKERENQVAGTLSGGERKMLSIAMGLSFSPKLILFDEPTFGLSPKLISSVYNSIGKLKEHGISIVIAEQSVSPIFEYGGMIDRIYLINEHKFTFSGSLDDIKNIEDIKKLYFGI